MISDICFFFFFQAEDGIRDFHVTGVQTCALPIWPRTSPFLDDEERAEIDRWKRTRLSRPDQIGRERYFFYTLCTRARNRLYLVREAAGDEGSPREPSPFWDEVRSLFPIDTVERWTTRRRLSALTWPLEQAPTERERLRAVAALVPTDLDAALSLANANGWERKLARARNALDRPTELRHPAVLETLRSRASFGVTELETFAGCSSIWLFERVVSPRRIDAQA